MLNTKHINDVTAATALLDIQHCQSKKENGKMQCCHKGVTCWSTVTQE